MKGNLLENVNRSLHMAALQIKKHSPAILLGAGLVGTVVGTVLACKATLKAQEVVKETKETLAVINDEMNNQELIEADANTEAEYKKAVATTYLQTGVSLAKIYAPAAVVSGLSIASILASYKVLNARNVAISAAYTLVDKGFKDYRKRVKERFGDRIDYELKNNIKTQKVETIEVDNDGNVKTEVKEVDVCDAPLSEYSVYSRFFDETSDNWVRDAEYNRMFLENCQRMANEKLRTQGYLFLNDVYKMLGLQESKAGQQVGWVYDSDNPVGDNYVDFGIYDVHKPGSRNFVNGYEKSILLDFNVDGNILDILA